MAENSPEFAHSLSPRWIAHSFPLECCQTFYLTVVLCNTTTTNLTDSVPPSVYRDQLMVSSGSIRMHTALRLEGDRGDVRVPNCYVDPAALS